MSYPRPSRAPSAKEGRVRDTYWVRALDCAPGVVTIHKTDRGARLSGAVKPHPNVREA